MATLTRYRTCARALTFGSVEVSQRSGASHLTARRATARAVECQRGHDAMREYVYSSNSRYSARVLYLCTHAHATRFQSAGKLRTDGTRTVRVRSYSSIARLQAFVECQHAILSSSRSQSKLEKNQMHYRIFERFVAERSATRCTFTDASKLPL